MSAADTTTADSQKGCGGRSCNKYRGIIAVARFAVAVFAAADMRVVSFTHVP